MMPIQPSPPYAIIVDGRLVQAGDPSGWICPRCGREPPLVVAQPQGGLVPAHFGIAGVSADLDGRYCNACWAERQVMPFEGMLPRLVPKPPPMP